MKKFRATLAIAVCLVILSSSLTIAAAATAEYPSDITIEDAWEKATTVEFDENTNVLELSWEEQPISKSAGYVDKHSLYVVPLTDDAESAVAEALSTWTTEPIMKATDSSRAVTITAISRIEYKDTDKGRMKRLTKIRGALTAGGSGSNVGSGVTITSNKITYGGFGYYNGGYGNSSDNITLANDTRVYSINVTTPWYYDVNGEVGHTYCVKLTRGSTWSVEATCNL